MEKAWEDAAATWDLAKDCRYMISQVSFMILDISCMCIFMVNDGGKLDAKFIIARYLSFVVKRVTKQFDSNSKKVALYPAGLQQKKQTSLL